MTNKRWIKSMIAEAQTAEAQLPWARGAAKAAMSARMAERFTSEDNFDGGQAVQAA